MTTSAEQDRLAEVHDSTSGWRRWGPYVSDRAWATVREDYSADGEAWTFLPHDQARSKAYRWGEDAIAGICDRYQLIVLAPSFWNGRDSILKERMFGLSGPEGNHGEDVKEYYYYLDATPTHSYLRFLYKYPQGAYPYERLVSENAQRTNRDPEFELMDTGLFDENRYFDIEVEYAKFNEEDIAIRIRATNRGPDPAPLHLIPQLWFRNTWSWGPTNNPAPQISAGPAGQTYLTLTTDDSMVQTLATVPVAYRIGPRTLYAPLGGQPMFTNNESNPSRVPTHRPRPDDTKYYKDAFHRQVVDNDAGAVNPSLVGSKAGIHYRLGAIRPGETVTLHFRFSDTCYIADPLAEVDDLIDRRRAEADAYYATIHPEEADLDVQSIQRQALSGLIWTKQAYIFDVNLWLKGDDPANPPPEGRGDIRNGHWKHLNSMRVLTVCDKWEYPWFAAWDLAFQCVPFALVDPDFAKNQLWCLLFEQFQHPNGQIPAFEWDFSDLNPPVHAWAVWRVYNMDRVHSGKADREWLERCFHKLLINFAWWINKVDKLGNNVFEGGFLGLDNIAVVDRSEPGRNGSVIEQSDATGWMGMFCLNLMRIALELARENRTYEALATKFFQHYTYIAAAMKSQKNNKVSLWDEKDGFFYDILRFPDGHYEQLKVRSLVGLIPLFAVERLEEEWIKPFEEFSGHLHWFLKNRPELTRDVVHTIEHDGQTTHALTILNQEQILRMTGRIMDPNEFLSDYGIRSLSKAHLKDPFVYDGKKVGYEPAEAISKIKGGNSNWRGPLWFPTSFLLIESLRKLGKAFGSGSPKGEEKLDLPYDGMAREIATRMIATFTRDGAGRRPVFGAIDKFQHDPHWRDHILFYEYFNGDNGAGLGASHQTGWTALIANLIDEWSKP